jgi:molybdopterin synthase sulfur carrier subunit
VAQVRLDGMLREFVRVRTVRTEAADVRGLLEDLEGRYPRLLGKLRDETGSLRRFVRVFVNGEDVSVLRGLETPVASTDEVDILHSIAGG